MNSFPLPRITLRWDNTPSAALRLHSASNLRPIPYPLPNKSCGYSSSTKASKQTSLCFAFAALLKHRSGYDEASENHPNLLLCLQLLLRRLKTYFPCWRESFLKVYKTLDRSPSSGKVLSSCAPKEVDMDDKEVVTNKFVIDCGTSQQCVVGGIVALGKFDALHVGHRELAVQASKTGIPFLLSFVGIAEVLGFESRPPIVANCDRKRVLSSWAPLCGNVVPLEYRIDFSSVRYLTPRQFVERLSRELGVAGVVAGANYRFGYKAAGDAKDLVRLCEEYGLSAYIVSPVMDKTHRGSQNGASVSTSSSDLGQVSSTRIRAALAVRDMGYVAELLGRKHRLVLAPMNEEFRVEDNTIIAPKSSLLNQPPGDGEFSNCTLLLDGVSVGLASVAIDSMRIRIESDCRKQAAELAEGGGVIGIEF